MELEADDEADDEAREEDEAQEIEEVDMHLATAEAAAGVRDATCYPCESPRTSSRLTMLDHPRRKRDAHHRHLSLPSAGRRRERLRSAVLPPQCAKPGGVYSELYRREARFDQDQEGGEYFNYSGEVTPTRCRVAPTQSCLAER